MPCAAMARFHLSTPRWQSSTYASRSTSFIALRSGTSSRDEAPPSVETLDRVGALERLWSS